MQQQVSLVIRDMTNNATDFRKSLLDLANRTEESIATSLKQALDKLTNINATGESD